MHLCCALAAAAFMGGPMDVFSSLEAHCDSTHRWSSLKFGAMCTWASRHVLTRWPMIDCAVADVKREGWLFRESTVLAGVVNQRYSAVYAQALVTFRCRTALHGRPAGARGPPGGAAGPVPGCQQAATSQERARLVAARKGCRVLGRPVRSGPASSLRGRRQPAERARAGLQRDRTAGEGQECAGRMEGLRHINLSLTRDCPPVLASRQAAAQTRRRGPRQHTCCRAAHAAHMLCSCRAVSLRVRCRNPESDAPTKVWPLHAQCQVSPIEQAEFSVRKHKTNLVLALAKRFVRRKDMVRALCVCRAPLGLRAPAN